MDTSEGLQLRVGGLFPDVLGLRFMEAAPERVVAELKVRDDLCTTPGIMHGGAIMAFADTLGGAATALNLPPGAGTATIESKTNFFAAARTGETVRGECTPLHRGKRTMVWQTRVTSADGRLLALVTQTQIVLEPVDVNAMAATPREDRAEWEALLAVLDAHPEGALHDPSSPSWTSRDVYTHLAFWIEHSTAHLKAALAGGSVPDLEGTDDEINARAQQQYSHLSLDAAREWAQRVFERRLQAIESVPAERWDHDLARIARADGAEHYRRHRGYIVTGSSNSRR